MLGMEKMLMDMLKKHIPPEMQELMTKENVEKLGAQAQAFVADIRGSLARIEAMQFQLAEAVERMENERSNGNGGFARKRAGKSSASDSDGSADK